MLMSSPAVDYPEGCKKPNRFVGSDYQSISTTRTARDVAGRLGDQLLDRLELDLVGHPDIGEARVGHRSCGRFLGAR